ncbi:MAG: patatin-like protein [Acidimicrobiia bacterium]
MTALQPTQQVRLAVVLYGGVSLCIYMNGVTQELLHLVRATAPDGAGTVIPETDLTSTEKVYRKLGQLLRHGEEALAPKALTHQTPVATQFVVDIVTGSSAGGINGIYLAKALANRQPIGQLEDLWIAEGDFDAILNDAQSVADVEGVEAQRPPRSLLNGRRMYRRLLEAFDGMGPDATGPGYVDEIDLYVTTTDLAGIVLPLPGLDSVQEMRHKAVFHLAHRTMAVSGEDRRDFVQAHNPILAFAGRATSSFPVAFEPMTTDEASQVMRAPGAPGGPPADWSIFLSGYTKDALPGSRQFGDGGDIDNKPFSYAIDALARRTAALPVVRKLLFVEPDPGNPRDENGTPQAFNPFTATLQAGLLGRNETIREDLQRVVDHNAQVARINEVIESVDAALLLVGSEAVATNDTATWLAEDRESRRGDLGYIAYHGLKVDVAVRALAGTLGDAVGGGTPVRQSVERALRTWVDARYADPFRGPLGDPRPSVNRFILDFDVAYRVRRLNFVNRRLARAHARDGVLDDLLAVTERARLDDGAERLAARDEILVVKGGLADAFVRLRQIDVAIRTDETARRLLAGATALDPVVMDAVMARVLQVTSAGLGEARGRLDAAVKGPAPTGPGARGRALVRAATTDLVAMFDAYDEVTLALTTAADGEAAHVDVVRIAPEEAVSLVPASAAGTKLAGTSLHHFGAFLDAEWRRHDVMWGRLDAAEQLVAMVVPPGPVRDQLVTEAQDAILEDSLRQAPAVAATVAMAVAAARSGAVPKELGLTESQADRVVRDAALAAATPAARREWLRAHPAPPAGPPPARTVPLAARAARVVGAMLDGVAGDDKRVGFGIRLLARVTNIAWGLVAVALPQRPLTRLAGWWLQLLLGLEVAMIVLGAVLGQPAAVHLGWIALALTGAAALLRALLMTVVGTGSASRLKRMRTLVVATLLSVAVALAAVGAVHLNTTARRWACRQDTSLTDLLWYDCPPEAEPTG